MVLAPRSRISLQRERPYPAASHHTETERAVSVGTAWPAPSPISEALPTAPNEVLASCPAHVLAQNVLWEKQMQGERQSYSAKEAQ